jgi:hypothetical protein
VQRRKGTEKRQARRGAPRGAARGVTERGGAQEYLPLLDPDWGVFFTDAATSCHWCAPHTYTHTYIHTYARTPTHTHARAHTHTHSFLSPLLRNNRAHWRRPAPRRWEDSWDLGPKRAVPTAYRRALPLGAFAGGILWHRRAAAALLATAVPFCLPWDMEIEYHFKVIEVIIQNPRLWDSSVHDVNIPLALSQPPRLPFCAVACWLPLPSRSAPLLPV